MPDDPLRGEDELLRTARAYFAQLAATPVPSSLTGRPDFSAAGATGGRLLRRFAPVLAFIGIAAPLAFIIVVSMRLAPQHSLGVPGFPTFPPGQTLPTCAAAAPGATGAAGGGPQPPRAAASMAYDAATQQVVLFGGSNLDGSSAAYNQTWTWDGRTWTQRATAMTPPGREEAQMAYDPATKTIVLFGGVDTDGTPLTDTWIWDGTEWRPETLSVSPPPRRDAAIAYDDALGKVVMFGGWNSIVGGPAKYDDTWTWDGSNWTQLFPSTVPAKRASALMAYDPASHHLVMFGGDTGSSTNETWAFDGQNWSRVALPSSRTPPAREAFALAPDGANGTIVIFGGEEPSTPPGSSFPTVGASNDTWTWNEGRWTEQHPSVSPPARGVETIAGSMVYDAGLGVDVLYGGAMANGSQAWGDTWTWNGITWTKISDNTGPGGCRPY
jgi:hypothetical protein